MPAALSSWIEGLAGAALIGLHLLSPWLHRQRTCWGATPEELSLSFPGDDLFPLCQWSYTHAIPIHAQPERVWPWVAQIGQGRGGFYSYTFLENLIGCRIANTDKILPEFQEFKPGEGVRLHPKAPPLPVRACVKNHYLLLYSEIDVLTGGVPQSPDVPAKRLVQASWLLYLLPLPDGSTRLLSRGHYAFAPTLLNRLLMGSLALEPISFVMERKMLKEIKRLVENSSAR